MIYRKKLKAILRLWLSAWLAISGVKVSAQSERVSLEGYAVDQQGAVIIGAKVSLAGQQNSMREAITDDNGHFHFPYLPAGPYKLVISAEGFASQEKRLDLQKSISAANFKIVLFPQITETVEVSSHTSLVSLDPQGAAGSQVLTPVELQALPDDPDQLGAQLNLLAASSGGAPDQTVVSVDGFAGSRLPPKSAIREVRINPDLFSAEYDKAPFRGGRIEVITKPGAASYQGTVFFNFNNSALNARDAFAPVRAPSTTYRYGLEFGGPIVRNRAGFIIDTESRQINEFAVVNAVTLGSDLTPVLFAANVPASKRLLIISGRADWQINTHHSLIGRYDYTGSRLENEGVGGFNLAEHGTNHSNTSHSFRFSETTIFNPKAINELRFGATLQTIAAQPLSNAPAILVPGAFFAGGATLQGLSNDERQIEIDDNLNLSFGKHSLKLGTQIFRKQVTDVRAENYNGTFIFSGGLAPKLAADGEVITGPDGPVLLHISGLEQYRRTLLHLPGGSPTRFTLTTGDPRVDVTQWRFAGFVQDEWRILPNLSFSLGLRYEGQTHPTDNLSLAPRLGIAFSPDKDRRWVLRARAGLFYDRVTELIELDNERLDGVLQRSLEVYSPSFPAALVNGQAEDLILAVRRPDPTLRPPSGIQTQVGIERQLTKQWKVQMSYSWSRGWGLLRSRNINPPLAVNGVADPLLDMRPFGVRQDILQFESSGKSEGTVLFVGANCSSNKYLNVYSGYLLFDYHTDADSRNLFPQSSFDLSGEWARPSWQARQRVFVVLLMNLPLSLKGSANFTAASGLPFNITTGRDNNGDGIFNDRPDWAANDPQAIVTRLGAFNPNVINGNVPRNAGTSPATFNLDFNLSRSFALSAKPPSGDNRRSLVVNVRVSNLLNHTNVLGLNGVLLSPFFGQANTAAPARRVEAGLRFNF
jgi:hypothetical protein